MEGKIEIACSHLIKGDIIAYPTESVWGIGCDPYDELAVKRIVRLKNRSIEKGLILVAGGLEQLEALIAPLDDELSDRLKNTWPGPITWLIPDYENCYPDWIKGQHSSVAIRVSAHPLVLDLCRQFGRPIVSTSANSAGETEIKSKSRLKKQFGNSIDYILDGNLGGRESTSVIKDLISGKILR